MARKEVYQGVLGRITYAQPASSQSLAKVVNLFPTPKESQSVCGPPRRAADALALPRVPPQAAGLRWTLRLLRSSGFVPTVIARGLETKYNEYERCGSVEKEGSEFGKF